MDWITLERTGMPVLKFEGTHIAVAVSRKQSGAAQNRWHTIDAYRTKGGSVALSIQFHSLWQGESGHAFAIACDTPEEATLALTRYDPLSHWVGYPTGERHAEKQKRIEHEIGSAYRSAITEIFAALPETAERID